MERAQVFNNLWKGEQADAMYFFFFNTRKNTPFVMQAEEYKRIKRDRLTENEKIEKEGEGIEGRRGEREKGEGIGREKRQHKEQGRLMKTILSR